MNNQRQCGHCHVCCITPAIYDGVVKKPACTVCPFLTHGCSLFGQPERPQTCIDYYCAWIQGYGDTNDQPYKNNVMVTIGTINGGTWILVLDLVKNAHLTTGKNIILDLATKFDLPVIICDFDHLADGKSDYVIIKQSLDSRCSKIKGEFISKYTDDMNIYKLIIN